MGILTGNDVDAEIVNPLRDGRPEAIEVIYDRYAGLAYGLALRITGDAGRAEDVVQEVLLSVWRKPDRYDPSRGSFRTWLMTLVRNRSIDNLRGHWRHQGADVELGDDLQDASGHSDPWPAVALSLERDVVRAALAALPADQRQAVEMAHYGGFSHSEIATKLGLPLGTVKGRLRLAMEKMHVFLTARGVVGVDV
ncbi:MAG: sigma-70 family RNA polymerase sigma factor [Candidatus Dormibacteraeota bacterium]|nr:sigma-70 family RNA polymerase sigma factor [Candidatus Dormibacteraeota bacterium]